MKKNIGSIVVFVVGLLASQITQAQGTVYLSNLDLPSAGSDAVGNDSWLGVLFQTGNNASGYTLNWIQLAMADASGNPSGITAMLYTETGNPADFVYPGISLATLNGSLNPVTAGTYTYTAPSNLTLSPNTPYFIVLTAGTAVATGAYEWSFAGRNPYGGSWLGFVNIVQSSDGLSWGVNSNYGAQYAINATAIPEPSPLFLLLLGSGAFIYVRRAFRR